MHNFYAFVRLCKIRKKLESGLEALERIEVASAGSFSSAGLFSHGEQEQELALEEVHEE